MLAVENICVNANYGRMELGACGLCWSFTSGVPVGCQSVFNLAD